MFDYMWKEQFLPSMKCPECNYEIHFHGGYYPIEIVCQNCGAHLNLRSTLSKLNYPNDMYNKDGKIIISQKEKDE